MSQIVHSDQAPAPIGPYSQAIIHDGKVFTSGQVGFDIISKEMPESFAQQATNIFAHLEHILLAAGSDMQSIIKLNIFVTDLANFQVLNGIMSDKLGNHKPARSTVQVAALPAHALVEIDAIASLNQS